MELIFVPAVSKKGKSRRVCRAEQAESTRSASEGNPNARTRIPKNRNATAPPPCRRIASRHAAQLRTTTHQEYPTADGQHVCACAPRAALHERMSAPLRCVTNRRAAGPHAGSGCRQRRAPPCRRDRRFPPTDLHRGASRLVGVSLRARSSRADTAAHVDAAPATRDVLMYGKQKQ